jgi:hypothetical protein
MDGENYECYVAKMVDVLVYTKHRVRVVESSEPTCRPRPSWVDQVRLHLLKRGRSLWVAFNLRFDPARQPRSMGGNQ